MRSALLGVYWAGNRAQLEAHVRASTELTHRDPRAYAAALAVSLTAEWMAGQREEVAALLAELVALTPDPTWQQAFARMEAQLQAEVSTEQFAVENGWSRGISGFAMHSVPVAIYAALRQRNDFAAALAEAIQCGGDTDTVGAITGALVGARVGEAGMPTAWLDRVLEFPRNATLLRQLAECLAIACGSQVPATPVRYCWPAIPLRNLVFLVVVLLHGLRRLLPPY